MYLGELLEHMAPDTRVCIIPIDSPTARYIYHMAGEPFVDSLGLEISKNYYTVTSIWPVIEEDKPLIIVDVVRSNKTVWRKIEWRK